MVEAEKEVKHSPLGVREGRGGGVPQDQTEAGGRGGEGRGSPGMLPVNLVWFSPLKDDTRVVL